MYSIMRLDRLIPAYMDHNKLVLNTHKQVDGNMGLYTGTNYALQARLGELEDHKLGKVQDYIKALEQVEISPGLLQRAYKPDEWQSHDDYIGWLAASYFLETEVDTKNGFAERVYQYGKNYKCFNNLNPGKFDKRGYFSRFPGWWALVKASSGRNLNWFDKGMFALDIMSTLWKDDGHSGYLMDYLKILVIQNQKCWFLENLISFYKKQYLKRYPMGISTSYAEYFNVVHPYAKATIGIY